ncbi:ubiquinol-cytochrome C chaperone family protein [Microbaculum marinum]|uniref:Ubiquinol-cytochrome C chaperone family protein n=1 Tax=Microbaculum marinum TaxID=1764581 RepID=A0AAW9RP46_9HYPH
MLRRFFKRFQSDDRANVLYGQIVAQARQPAFYAELGVPDTPEGRFDMIVLHVVLVMRRLRGEDARGRALAQALFDAFMADMDRNLREMGTGDLSVPRRVRGMAEAFYGRAGVYDSAIDANSAEGLQAALERNLFAGRSGERVADQADIDAMASYVLLCGEALAATAGSDVMAAILTWPAVPSRMETATGEG